LQVKAIDDGGGGGGGDDDDDDDNDTYYDMLVSMSAPLSSTSRRHHLTCDAGLGRRLLLRCWRTSHRARKGGRSVAWLYRQAVFFLVASIKGQEVTPHQQAYCRSP
jgi:hypothetical protein